MRVKRKQLIRTLYCTEGLWCLVKVSEADSINSGSGGEEGVEEGLGRGRRRVKMAKFSPVLFVFVCLVVGYAVATTSEKTCDTVFKGCSIEKGVCTCGEKVDCHNPFPYKDENQCMKDIKGQLDKCKKEPCAHGRCVQSKHDQTRRWECSCSGSGYYGKRCELECPPFDQAPLPDGFPNDCVY